MKKRFLAFLMLIVTIITLVPNIAFAADSGSTDLSPLESLKQKIQDGKYDGQFSERLNYADNFYKEDGGGTVLWFNLFNINGGTEQFFNEDKFQKLTQGEKQKFLEHVFRLANAYAYETEVKSADDRGPNDITSDTVTDLMDIIQSASGMGSAMLATLLSQTKPDYVAANRIYEPFSGVVGTILGIISVLILALLGVTMAMDLAYITIPAFQMACGGESDGKDGGKKGVGALISAEARKAVKSACDGDGGQSGSGDYKAAVGIYFKYRWKGLVILGICLLYLVQGQIYSFVSWFIDLFSGFLGF